MIEPMSATDESNHAALTPERLLVEAEAHGLIFHSRRRSLSWLYEPGVDWSSPRTKYLEIMIELYASSIGAELHMREKRRAAQAARALLPAPDTRYSFAEFFSGIGCARIGLGPEWSCRFANDSNHGKAWAYCNHFGDEDLHVGDIRDVDPARIPTVDCAWASPPCQDLSEAGKRGGIHGRRSEAFWPFAELLHALKNQQRAPKLVVVENVKGMVSGRDGQDVIAVVEALSGLSYSVGGLIVDARWFVAQSRPRVFLVGVREDLPIPANLVSDRAVDWCSSPALIRALEGRVGWWPRLPAPTEAPAPLESCFDPGAQGWIPMRLSDFGEPSQRAVEARLAAGGRHLGAAFRRTRRGIPVWETRFDGRAGALRTAAGGSSRQSWLRIENGQVARRFFTPRECARVMGIPDAFQLPFGSDGLSAVGDGLCPAIVRHLAQHLLEPILNRTRP